MLNAQSSVQYKAFAFILSPHLLGTTSTHPCYNHFCLERGSCYEDVLVLGIRNPQLTACDVWSLRFPGLSVNSDNLSFSYVILFLLFTFVNYMHEN
jgi:hypothetical protein